MTADRIRSRHGNVIAADFRPRTSAQIAVTLTTETLYHDGHVTLLSTTAAIGGTPIATTHVLGDLATGQATSL